MVGVVLGLVVASAMTILDWRLNPGGIFHNEQGTDWDVVTATAVSWFAPVGAAATILVSVVLFVVSRLK